MAITAAQVKGLRETTGLGMMECKRALVETNGDQEAAIDLLRKKAGSKVEKKASRTAADGAIGISISEDKKIASMVEVNSETDFVAKGDEFIGFANAVANCVRKDSPADVDALMRLNLESGESVGKTLEEMVSKLGENMTVRRFVRMESRGDQIGQYVHGRRIGALVDLEGGDETLAKDLAMHIAATRPKYISKDDVSHELIDKEKEIFSAQAKDSGKPDEIIEKIVAGQVNKLLNEITLLGRPFVKDDGITISKLLEKASARVHAFHCYEVGEGIEKKVDDFAAEVMAQVKGA